MQIHQNTKSRRRAALSIAALIAITSPRAHAAAAADAEHAAVQLEVDTSLLEEASGLRLRATLEEQLTKVLLADGFEVVADGAATTIVAHVEMPDVALREYAISVDLLADEAREVVVAGVPCVACTEQQVVDKAITLLPDVAQRLTAREAPPPSVIEPAPPRVVDDPTRLKLGPIGLSGAVTLAGGVTSMAAGAVLMSLSKQSAAAFGLNPRAVGASVLVVGGLATALGIAAVVVDVKLLEPRRRARRLEISADLSATRAGLSLSGRF